VRGGSVPRLARRPSSGGRGGWMCDVRAARNHAEWRGAAGVAMGPAEGHDSQPVGPWCLVDLNFLYFSKLFWEPNNTHGTPLLAQASTHGAMKSFAVRGLSIVNWPLPSALGTRQTPCFL
jgi:hypothetical protein